MDEMPAIRPILTNGVELPKTPRASVFDWVWYYIYNLLRKPFVWRWRKELNKIENHILGYVRYFFLSDLIKQVRGCHDCATAYESIQPQFLVSQVKFMMEKMKCDEHPELFDKFLHVFRDDLKRSEYLARRINGF